MLLPYYNGHKFIEQQVKSIYNQTLRPNRLIIRDDQSTDESSYILHSFQDQYGEWLQLHFAGSNQGCTDNINRLLELSSADYVALADQDDIWLPAKIEDSLYLLQEAEDFFGKSYPLLVYTDLTLICSNGTKISDSFYDYMTLYPERNQYDDLIYTNVVTGCTTLMNKALVHEIYPIPQAAKIHDWWTALVAAKCGKLLYLNKKTVLYRQHTGNLVGAKHIFQRNSSHILNELKVKRKQNYLQSLIDQNEAVLKRYGYQEQILKDLLKANRWKRLTHVFVLVKKKKLRKHGMLRTILLIIKIIMQ